METAIEQKRIEINEENPVVRIAVYGSLRKGGGNHYLLRNKSNYLGTFKTKSAYTMYNAGGFPIVSTIGENSIECEVYEIRVKGVLEQIHRLEGCTGIPGHIRNWYDIQTIETPFGEAAMYVQHKILDNPVVQSGNWNSIK